MCGAAGSLWSLERALVSRDAKRLGRAFGFGELLFNTEPTGQLIPSVGNRVWLCSLILELIWVCLRKGHSNLADAHNELGLWPMSVVENGRGMQTPLGFCKGPCYCHNAVQLRASKGAQCCSPRASQLLLFPSLEYFLSPTHHNPVLRISPAKQLDVQPLHFHHFFWFWMP